MANAVTFVLMMLAAAAMVALALVWPQGQGAVSPPPFGHPLAPLAAPHATVPPENRNAAAPPP